MPGGIHPPIKEILSWPKPDYANPVTQPPYVLYLSCILGPLSIALSFTRLWVRIRVQRNPGLDDWLMLASIVPATAVTIMWVIVTERYRFDRHVWDVEFKYFVIQRKYVMAIYSCFTLACGLVKMSILLFYRRLSSRAVSPSFRWTLRITIIATALFTAVFTVIHIFTCRPLEAFWNQLDIFLVAKNYQYKCFNEGADVVSNGIISAFQDAISALLPTILCWNLQMPLRQKIALYSIFAISYGTVAVGGVRAYTGYRIYFQSYDVTCMCANAPALKFFFLQFFSDGQSGSFGRSKPSRTPHSNNTYLSYGSANSKLTLGEKLQFWKASESSRGYISGNRTQTTTDEHGGIVRSHSNADPYSRAIHMDNLSRLSPEYMETVISRNSGRSSDDTLHEAIEMNRREHHVSPLASHPIDNNDIQSFPQVGRPEPAMWPLGPYRSTKERYRGTDWQAPWAEHSQENLTR